MIIYVVKLRDKVIVNTETMSLIFIGKYIKLKLRHKSSYARLAVATTTSSYIRYIVRYHRTGTRARSGMLATMLQCMPSNTTVQLRFT